MIERWRQFDRREQGWLLILAGAITLYLLWVLLIAPLRQMVVGEQKKHHALQTSVDEARVLAGQIVALKQAGTGTNRQSSGDLSQLLNATLRNNGMAMNNFRPSADGNSATLRFELVPFNNLLQWLYQLEVSHHISVATLSVNPGQDKGLVSVSLRVARQ